MDLRSLIAAEMERVASEHDKRLAPLAEELPLIDCGLDSLCFAILVARLEDRLGFDPFSLDETLEFPTTFGAFVRFYDRLPA